MKYTVITLDYTRERMTLPQPLWQNSESCNKTFATGRALTGLYYSPRRGRYFRRVYSLWQAPHGGVTGEYVEEIDHDQFLHMCDITDTHPPTKRAEGLDSSPTKRAEGLDSSPTLDLS